MQILISLSSTVEYKGKKLFKEANTGLYFPKGVEGYWRPTIKSKEKLPFPVAFKPSGYDKEEFLSALRKAERRAKFTSQKGFARHRWTREPNKTGEYSLSKWKWPEGYVTYIENGVPPSRSFFQFIMKQDLETLPELHEVD